MQCHWGSLMFSSISAQVSRAWCSNGSDISAHLPWVPSLWWILLSKSSAGLERAAGMSCASLAAPCCFPNCGALWRRELLLRNVRFVSFPPASKESSFRGCTRTLQNVMTYLWTSRGQCWSGGEDSHHSTQTPNWFILHLKSSLIWDLYSLVPPYLDILRTPEAQQWIAPVPAQERDRHGFFSTFCLDFTGAKL